MNVPAAPTRPIRPLTIAVIVLLAVQIGLLAFQAAAFIRRIDLLHEIQRGAFVTKTQADASDQLVAQGAALWSMTFLACAFVWLVWQHHAQVNARALTNGGTSITPGWAVGWWFIPFANLVKPYQAMHELRQASAGGPAWYERGVVPAIVIWWFTWIGFNVIGVFALGDRTTVDSLITADRFHLVSVLIGIVSACLAIWIVRSVLTRQERAIAVAERPGLPPAPIPPPPMPTI